MFMETSWKEKRYEQIPFHFKRRFLCVICVLIAEAMIKEFTITEEEAIGRMNKLWGRYSRHNESIDGNTDLHIHLL